jgi:hypothetical protein
LAMARFPFVFFVEREWTARLSQLISRRGRNFWKRITSFERQAGCWFEKFLNSVRDGINHRLCRVHRAGLADMNAGDVVGVGFCQPSMRYYGANATSRPTRGVLK